VNIGRTTGELDGPMARPYVSTLRCIGARAGRRLAASLVVVLALAGGLAGCGGSDDDKTTTTSSSVPGGSTSTTDSTATTATTVLTGTTRAGSANTGATTATTAGAPPGTSAAPQAPSVVVTLFAQKGEIPPGQTQPLDAPAWKATGVGWDPGHVDLIVKRSDGPSVVLSIGAEADGDGRFEQTFVVLDVKPGTYAAIASQGGKRAEGSFVL
jgi:hypothetical protein